jgi:hypothetical protein
MAGLRANLKGFGGSLDLFEVHLPGIIEENHAESAAS